VPAHGGEQNAHQAQQDSQDNDDQLEERRIQQHTQRLLGNVVLGNVVLGNEFWEIISKSNQIQ
jgi:hypothetical protein